MTPEKQRLIRDLLDEPHDARRHATLMAGGRIFRWRRVRRRSIQTLAVLAVITVTAVFVQRSTAPRPQVQMAVPATPPSTETAKSLSDEELLALFPDTPVGLLTLADGTKQLIFPRPGDEERFVKRL